MKELKIDPKLAALFKPLEKEQLDELEENSKQNTTEPLFMSGRAISSLTDITAIPS